MALRDWLFIFVLGIGWGGSFFLNEILLLELGPIWIACLRIAFGALFCWGYLAMRGKGMWPDLRTAGALFVLGLFYYSLPFFIYPQGQAYITAGASGIINAMTPIAVVIVSHFWPGGEKATLLKSGGVALGFVGIVILALPKIGSGSEFWALIFTLLAPLCYAIALNHLRRLSHLPRVPLTAWSLTFGSLLLVPVAFLAEGTPHITAPATWAALAFIGLILTGLFFIIMFGLVARVGATAASTVTFIAPISAVFLGATFLGEVVTHAQIGGMAAIFAGLILIDGRLIRSLGRKA